MVFDSTEIDFGFCHVRLIVFLWEATTFPKIAGSDIRLRCQQLRKKVLKKAGD
jgi:hypothetical protein